MTGLVKINPQSHPEIVNRRLLDLTEEYGFCVRYVPNDKDGMIFHLECLDPPALLDTLCEHNAIDPTIHDTEVVL